MTVSIAMLLVVLHNYDTYKCVCVCGGVAFLWFDILGLGFTGLLQELEALLAWAQQLNGQVGLWTVVSVIGCQYGFVQGWGLVSSDASTDRFVRGRRWMSSGEEAPGSQRGPMLSFGAKLPWEGGSEVVRGTYKWASFPSDVVEFLSWSCMFSQGVHYQSLVGWLQHVTIWNSLN